MIWVSISLLLVMTTMILAWHVQISWRLAALSTIFTGVGALGLYLLLGMPHFSDIPLNSRKDEIQQNQLAKNMVRNLEIRLKENPGNIDGWLLLSRSYQVLGRLQDSADALKMSIVNGDNRPGTATAYASLLIDLAGGTVTSEAEHFLVLAAADDPQARYLKGVMLEQRGDIKAALAEWTELTRAFKTTVPWRHMVIKRITTAAHAINEPIPDLTPVPLAPLLAKAHAIYPPGSKEKPPEAFIDLMRKIYNLDDNNPEALWFLGNEAASKGDRTAALELLNKLLTLIPHDTQIRTIINDVIVHISENSPEQSEKYK